MMVYLHNYWVEVDSYSPKARIVRFRKLSRGREPIQRMGRLRFERDGRPG